MKSFKKGEIVRDLEMQEYLESIPNGKEFAYFIRVFLSDNEYEKLKTRIRIARLLLAGFSWQKIQQLTKASTATILQVKNILNKLSDAELQKISFYLIKK